MGIPPLVLTIDLALAIIGVELGLLVLAAWRNPAKSRRPLLFTVLSGLGLLLALRTVAVGADALLTLSALTLGGLAHIADMATRLRRSPDGATR